nr:histone lysine N methyltransferase [Hymenolepis microstoma]
MRPKKSRRRGNGNSPAKSPPLTPAKPPGRRGRPPSKPPSTALHHPSISSHENNHNSLSPEHSRTSSSDQDAYHSHQAPSQFNPNPVLPPNLAGAPINSNLPPSYISPNEAFDRPRKLAKRERRAIIKYSRRSRAVIDESFLATMNDLSIKFYSNCNIGPFKPQPIPRATDPSNPPAPVSLPTSPLPQNPSPRSGRGRGRRSKQSPISSIPSKPLKPSMASLSPLCLPFNGLPNQLKPPITKLERLSHKCARRFLKAANVLLIPSTTVSRFFESHDPSSIYLPPPQPTPSLLPNQASSQFTPVSTTTTIDASAASITTANSTNTTTTVGQLNGFICNDTATVPTGNTLTSSTTPLVSPIKRGRGRPPKSAKKSLSPQPPLPDFPSSAFLTAQPSIKSKSSLSRRGSTGTPRELKHLVTWDAMMKAASQESLNSGGDPTKGSIDAASPLTLQILPSPNEEGPDQRTTRGRVRKLSVGPASSLGSGSEHAPSNNSSSVVKSSLSPTGSELRSGHFREELLLKNEHSPSVDNHHAKGGRKRRATPPRYQPISEEVSALASPASSTTGTIAKLLDVDALQTGGTVLSSAALLPPRKRYKGVSDRPGSDNDLAGGSVVTEDEERESILRSFSSFPLLDGDVDGLKSQEQLGKEMAAVEPEIPKKRPRGRPSKRNQSPSGRPKREAAAIGFASMVSSSINSTSVHSMLTEGQQLGMSTSSSTADEVRRDELSVVAPPAYTPGKRGRKPKKYLMQASTAIPLTAPAVVTSPKPRGRPPKHPKPVVVEEVLSLLPPVVEIEEKCPTPMASDIFIELKHPSLVSPELQSPNQEEPQAGKGLSTIIVSSPEVMNSQPASEPLVTVKKNKRGRPPLSSHSTQSLAPPLIKRRNLDMMSEENALIYGSRQLRLFLLRTHYSRRKLKAQHATEPQVSIGPCTTQALLDTGPIAELPSITAFFPFSELSSPLLEVGDEEKQENEKAWIRQLYARLLNTPDLLDLKTRLTAPLLSLPCPLRLPDFYRFICVSGLLNNFEAALEVPDSIQPKILATVSPQIIIGSAETKPMPPFYITGTQWPPLCLRDVIPRLSDYVEDFQKLDLLLEFLFRTWEAYAGRKNWIGKQLQQVRSLYSQLRTEHVAKHPDKELPLPPPTLSSGSASKNSGPIIAGSGAARKKVDRQTLERGAEVIRCLCGFRVEGGHVMIRCSSCVTSQHLPCVWWALSLDMNPRLAAPSTYIGSLWPNIQSANQKPSSIRLARCKAALIGALAAGGHDISVLCPFAQVPPAYYCPSCLELDGLTKDYPRSLAVSLKEHNVTTVFDKSAKRFDYWSLGTKNEQFLTDEFAIIYRGDFEKALNSGGKLTEEQLQTKKIERASDAVVVRIYGLWKDSSGKSWMEGGAFLRPYDLPENLSWSTEHPTLWHQRELVYDETSRLVLPLSALRGRCCVLAPPTYRIGRPADLPAIVVPPSEGARRQEQEELHPLVFLCERLMTRNDVGELILKEIAPAYLKIITKPYYFLRYPETSPLKAAIVRQFTPKDLKEEDSTTRFGDIISCGVEPGLLFAECAQRRWLDDRNSSVSPEYEQKQVEEKAEQSPQRPHRHRNLGSVLPLLKGTPLSEIVPTISTTFHHAPRKSPPVCLKFLAKSISISSKPAQPSLIKKRGRPSEASKAQQQTTSIKQLSFEELQKQMALLGDGGSKETKSAISFFSATPRKRGRKPKAVKMESIDVEPNGQIMPAEPSTVAKEGDDIIVDDRPIEIQVSGDDLPLFRVDESELNWQEESTELKLGPIEAPMTADASLVEDQVVFERVESVKSAQIQQHIHSQKLNYEWTSDFPEDFVEKVGNMEYSLPCGQLVECCEQEEIVDEENFMENTEFLVHETLESSPTEERPNTHESDAVQSSSPPLTNLAHLSKVSHLSVVEITELRSEECTDLPDDELEYLEAENFVQIVEPCPDKGSALCVISTPSILEYPIGLDHSNELDEKRENSNSSTSDVSTDGSSTTNTDQKDCHQSSSSFKIQPRTSSVSSSSSRRRKSSPKKRVFDDSEKILDLSAKSSSGVDE